MDALNNLNSIDIDTMPMRRMHQFSNKALVADWVSLPRHLDERHIEGINVSYGDASTQWVQRSVFDANLSQLDVFALQSGNDYLLTADESAGIFADLDAAR